MSKLGYKTNDIFTVARVESRQHVSANFNLARAYSRHEPMPGFRKLDVHNSAVPRSAQSKVADCPGDLFHLRKRFDFASRERPGFVQVGCEHSGKRQQFGLERRDAIGFQQRSATFGDHHRVHYQRS
jgi:hypothetical protein